MKDRQHGPIAAGFEKFVRVPGRGQRSGFGFAVTHDANDNQVGMIESDAIGVREAVAEFSAFMQRTGQFRRTVAANAARE